MSWTVTFEGVDTSISGSSRIKEMATSDEKMSPESIFETRVDSWGPVQWRGNFYKGPKQNKILLPFGWAFSRKRYIADYSFCWIERKKNVRLWSFSSPSKSKKQVLMLKLLKSPLR